MFKQLTLATLAACFISAPASAQDYPNRPISYILHVSPGGATDIMARKIALGLEKSLGVVITLVVERNVAEQCESVGIARICTPISTRPPPACWQRTTRPSFISTVPSPSISRAVSPGS